MKLFLASLVGGVIGASIIAGGFYFLNKPANLIAEYYNIENAVMVSPHGLRKDIVA